VTPGASTLNGWIIVALIVGGIVVGIAGLIVPGYIQAELNKIWERHPRLGSEGIAASAAQTPQPAPATPQTTIASGPAATTPSEPPPPPSLPPAGWYRDAASGRLRWWDGQRWTEHYHDA
jgi:hypothetical protein